MKRILLLLTLTALAASPVLAQDSTTTNTPPAQDGPHGGGHFGHGGPGGMGFLTKEEREELKAAHDAAFKANPAFQTESAAIETQREALRKKIDAAMIAADPKVAPIVAKLQAHKPKGGPGGPPPEN